MYIVKIASAHMPASCRGTYKRVAVIELEDGYADCSMISPHAKGVRRIVETWEKLHYSPKTGRSAYHRAMLEAAQLLAKLSTGEAIP